MARSSTTGVKVICDSPPSRGSQEAEVEKVDENYRESYNGQRLELAEGTPPRGLTYHCPLKAGNFYSSPLNICLVVLLLLRKRRGATALGGLQ
jgi:hypothetical protein